jgi:hypothetical protein
MAFTRARRHLSTLASGSNNQKTKAIEQTRSTSGSTVNSSQSNDLLSGDENCTGTTRKHRRSITFDKLLTNNEIQEGSALAPRENSPSTFAVHSQTAADKLVADKDQSYAVHADDKFPSLPQDDAPCHSAAAKESNGPLPSDSSSRRTTIWAGRPDIATQKPQEGQDKDEMRLDAEQSYYDSVNGAGKNRRRSMLRSVSKDDYLLARGANPRTGLVTPGIHSISNSNEEAELLKQRGIIPPPKWRQRGDQWVSLDIGESIPLPSPPKGSGKYQARRPLRTPPRLTTGKYNHVSGLRTAYQKPSVSAALPEDVPTPDGVPGRFPITPQTELANSSYEMRARPGAVIKRRPVGSTSAVNEQHAPPKLISPQHSTDTVVKRPILTQVRSSSAPVPHIYNFETPEDVGKEFHKALPSVPNEQNRSNHHPRQHIEFQDHFLGHQRLKEAENMSVSKTSVPFRQEKELPCLPMSNGQYLSRVLEEPVTRPSNVMSTTHSEARKPMGPQGGDPAHPFVRNTRMIVPPRRYQIDVNTSTGTCNTTPVMTVPTYDNPPSQMAMPSRPKRSMTRGPRPMHQPRSVSESIKRASNVFIGPPPTMYTSTSIPTHISTLQPMLQGTSHRMALGFEASQEQSLHHQPQDRFYPNDPRLWNRNMNNNMPVTMPGARTRAGSRPQMPDRANAHMRSVPRMNPLRANQVGYTDSCRPWRTNGIKEEAFSERNGISAANKKRLEIERSIMPNPLWPSNVTQNKVDPTGFKADEWSKSSTEMRTSGKEQEDHSSQSNGLTRNCSRCQHGSEADSLCNIDGQDMPLRSARPTEQEEQRVNTDIMQQPLQHGPVVTETTAALNSTNNQDEVDERDHTACCTECCTVEDCHEGCLGHPSPSIRSFGGSTVVDTTSGPSSPVHDIPSMSLSTSASPSPSKGKPSFVQGLRMRKTLRTKQCPDDGKTIKERCNALEPPQIELDSHPLSPGTFWGDGQDAVAAAKKAIGVRKRAVTASKVTGGSAITGSDVKGVKRNTSPPRLIIPKIRGLSTRNASDSNNAILPSRAPKSRNVSAASIAPSIVSASRSRNVSGASILSIEIPHIFSSLGTINVVGVFEMMRVPFEATAMWIHTHPEFKGWLWKGTEKAMSMARTVVETAGTVWEVSYVYSKTGRWRCKAQGGFGVLAMDCGRSFGYVLVLGALAVCVGRVLGFVLGLGQGLVWIVRLVGWLLKSLGLGILW